MSAAPAISRKLANGVLAGEGNSTVVVSSGIANREVNNNALFAWAFEGGRREAVADIPTRGLLVVDLPSPRICSLGCT